MTFDDIVKILLTEHRELDKLRSRLQAQEVEPEQAIRELFNEVDKVTPPAGYYRAAFGATKSRQPKQEVPQPQPLQKEQYGFRMRLPGLYFPVSKNELIEFCQNRHDRTDTDFTLLFHALQKLPKTDKMYGNERTLEEDLKQLFNTDLKLTDISKEIGIVTILTSEDLKTPTQHLEEERVKRKIMSKMVSGPET